jgi:hypothetical protein
LRYPQFVVTLDGVIIYFQQYIHEVLLYCSSLGRINPYEYLISTLSQVNVKNKRLPAYINVKSQPTKTRHRPLDPPPKSRRRSNTTTTRATHNTYHTSPTNNKPNRPPCRSSTPPPPLFSKRPHQLTKSAPRVRTLTGKEIELDIEPDYKVRLQPAQTSQHGAHAASQQEG